MSNRKKLKPRRTNPASMLIRAHDGAHIPGGCGTCDAYQEIRADHHGPNLHSIAIHHDDWCPTYQRIRETP
ncbi:hypothetical protein FHG89_27385 [Micromonospora orduensis]|uniref:Uncharacterized protein n=1 Tax=Micromonospora orduensis TaxID=1420891 RepID=A0A5C4QEA0_9ACTN|nr:hypothetical protein [Micromonospora orduensis]TNH23317.1 hypothetical protein FHG89_27385 [Micromonospora orduensis]